MHGDIKPSNVGFTSDGSPKLLDFGLARETSDAAATRGGSVRYLSPEVLSGRPADEADDVWSLCVMLHEIVSGEHPFAGNGVDEVTDRIRRQHLGRAARAPAGPDASSALNRVHGVHARRPPVGLPGNGPGLCRCASRCSPPTVGPPATPRGCGRSLFLSRTSVSIESGVLQTRTEDCGNGGQRMTPARVLAAAGLALVLEPGLLQDLVQPFEKGMSRARRKVRCGHPHRRRLSAPPASCPLPCRQVYATPSTSGRLRFIDFCHRLLGSFGFLHCRTVRAIRSRTCCASPHSPNFRIGQ